MTTLAQTVTIFCMSRYAVFGPRNNRLCDAKTVLAAKRKGRAAANLHGAGCYVLDSANYNVEAARRAGWSQEEIDRTYPFNATDGRWTVPTN